MKKETNQLQGIVSILKLLLLHFWMSNCLLQFKIIYTIYLSQSGLVILKLP
jgi:hypothetical protein